MAKRKHKFARTIIEHHKDNSHTTTHEHESGNPDDHVKYSRGDHDAMIDGLLQHTGDMNDGEESDFDGKPYPKGPHLPVGGNVPKGSSPEVA